MMISPEISALRLQAAIGTTPEMWLALQAKWDLYEARERLGGKLDQLPRLIDLDGSPPADQ